MSVTYVVITFHLKYEPKKKKRNLHNFLSNFIVVYIHIPRLKLFQKLKYKSQEKMFLVQNCIIIHNQKFKTYLVYYLYRTPILIYQIR